MSNAPLAASPQRTALPVLMQILARPIASVTRRQSLLVALALAAMPLAATADGFIALELPGTLLIALSRDGHTGVGGLLGNATGGFRWSDAHGVELLNGAMSVQGISASGRYIAGSALDHEQREVASYWTVDNRLVRLGGLPGTAGLGGTVSVALGISDGPCVVGMAADADEGTVAFRWDRMQGMRALPLPATAKSAHARGLSEDGRRVYGWMEPHPGQRRGVLWNDGVPQLLPSDHGDYAGEVVGGNRDVTVLLGVDIPPRGNAFAYRWRADTGPQPLTLPAQPSQFVASSDDGRVLVGSVGTGAIRTAEVWMTNAGQQSLVALLAARGVTIPAGWALTAATGISGDGRRIGGWGQHDGYLDSFIVDLPDAAASTAAASASMDAMASQ